jgi:hypothetical protein
MVSKLFEVRITAKLPSIRENADALVDNYGRFREIARIG